MYSSDKLFQRSWDGYFGVYFPSCEATREINTQITLEWAQKQFVTRVHTLFYFLHDITNTIMTIKTTILTHCPSVSLTRFSFCCWGHNRLLVTSQWPDNCDAITWIVISNSLDIKNNAWVTVNNDFWVTSEAICQWFSRVTKSRVKIIGKSYHEWPKNRYSR